MSKTYKFGFLVHDLSANEINYCLIRKINERIHKNIDEDFIVFYENLVQPCAPCAFSTMQMVEAYSFDGMIISTSLQQVQRALSFPVPKTILYMWELEWMRVQNKVFRQLFDLYNNKGLVLWSRSQSHANTVKQVWGANVERINDYDFDRMRELYDSVVPERKIFI